MEKIPFFIIALCIGLLLVLALESVGLLLRRYGFLRINSNVLEPNLITLIFRTKLKKVPYFWDRFGNREKKIHDRELMTVLLGLDEEKLNELLELYREEFGDGAARYARTTYRKWESGDVKPIRQTFERFLIHLPKVMTFDLKCEVLRHLMEEYCAKDSYNLTVYTDDWEETLAPLVAKIIEKPYNANLPKQIEERLIWLAREDMQIGRKIVDRSKVEEGRIAVSMLSAEFRNIEELLAKTNGRRKVTHRLKFPYGTIDLKIKRR